MFKRKQEEQDFVYFGEQRVEIPKLVVRKWKIMLETLETLPQIFLNIISAKGSDNFTAALVIGVSMAIEEIVRLVAVLTDLDEDYIYDNADHNDLMDFITKTIQKNNLNEAAKKSKAMFAQINKAIADSGKMEP